MMAKYKVIAKAKDTKGTWVKAGDKIVIENNMLNLEESKNVCVVALSAIPYSLFMMGKAGDPKEFGRDHTYTLQCPDPDTRVIYEITRTALED
jgi:uncharacterized repeat protein (TIGR04076 family)